MVLCPRHDMVWRGATMLFMVWCGHVGVSPAVLRDTVFVMAFVIASWSFRGTVQELVAAPRSSVVLLACGVGGCDPGLWGHGPYRLGWPLSQGHHCGSHSIAGGVIWVSRRTVFGWQVTVLVITAGRCCLISTAWHRDGVWPDRGDRCPLDPCVVNAACLLLSRVGTLCMTQSLLVPPRGRDNGEVVSLCAVCG
jgi:hypothetical protein